MPKQLTLREKTLKRMQTFTWSRFVLDSTGSKKKLYQLLENRGRIKGNTNLESYKKTFANYHHDSKRKCNVEHQNITFTNEVVPGSKDIYTCGPKNSFLFIAMSEDISEFSKVKESAQRNKLFWPLTHKIQNFSHYIEDNQYEAHPYLIEDTLAEITSTLENTEIKEQLKHYHIYDLILRWLYDYLVEWCQNTRSLCHRLYTVDSFPSEEQFVRNPKIFFKALLIEIARDPRFKIENGSILTTSKFIERKSLLWLPNEDFIRVQFKSIKQSSDITSRNQKIWFHAFIDTRKPMTFINQAIIRIPSFVFMLFFFTSFMFSLGRSMPHEATASLLFLVVSGFLFLHVTSTINKKDWWEFFQKP